MRVKLTEIISTMDQYNGIGEYMDKYKGGEQLDIHTDIPYIPKTAIVNEDIQKLITNLLNENVQTQDEVIQIPKKNTPTTPITPIREYRGQILKFDNFVNEVYFQLLSDDNTDDELDEDEE